MTTLSNLEILPEKLAVRPTQKEIDASVAAAKGALLSDIKRSAYIYRVDCGGCNGCEIEIFSAITPVFDAERFGIKLASNPRQADIMVYTGAMTRSMRAPAMRAYEQAPDPKIVVSYGACGCSGGIFHDCYCTWGGTDKLIPVDMYIPGCPPTPAQTLYGFALALGHLGQKLKHQDIVEADGESVALPSGDIAYSARVALERQARLMTGYRNGHVMVEEFVAQISASDANVAGTLDKFIASQSDPRRAEIYTALKDVLLGQLQKAA